MNDPEQRLLPMSCIAAMLAVTTTIVGLAYWVGDAMGPGFTSVVGASVRQAGAASAQPPRVIGVAASPAATGSAPVAPVVATRVTAPAVR